MTTLSGFPEPSADAWAAFRDLLRNHLSGAMFLPVGTTIPASLTVIDRFEVLQMVEETEPGRDAADSLELGDADVDEMAALARLTPPGPFDVRTIELGVFLGVRVEDRLAAMAGQRLHLPGFVEISAVCTHPDHCGRGYTAGLMRELARRIRAAGEVPFLHVKADNRRAVALYERLGFRGRRRFDYVLMQHPTDSRRRVPWPVVAGSSPGLRRAP
jgi:predicted GNAT family acetyltransferase